MAECCCDTHLLESHQETGILNPRWVLNLHFTVIEAGDKPTADKMYKRGCPEDRCFQVVLFNHFISDDEDRVLGNDTRLWLFYYLTWDNHLLSINQTNMVKAFLNLPLNQLFRWTNELHSPWEIMPNDVTGMSPPAVSFWSKVRVSAAIIWAYL